MASPMKYHVKIELDSPLDRDFLIYPEFKTGVEKIRYHAGTVNMSIEICELSEDGTFCRKHTSTGVHELGAKQ